MTTLAFLFWLSLACVTYTYLGYPLAVGVRARLQPRPVRRGPFHASVSIIVAARNEEATIARRVEELGQQVRDLGLDGEVIVVSDGSTDRTVACAAALENIYPVRVIALSENVGKAAALTCASQQVRGAVLVFADVRQTWANDALERLLENFADPEVGAVSGDLVLETAPGVMAGVGLYWRFEKWLRKKESLIHAQVGVTGAICAVRRELFRPIPPGTLLDDVYWPLQVAMHGSCVVHDERARAFDRLPDRPGEEFRRKVRTLAGNFQLVTRLPAALLPWRNPVWSALVSHKLLRLVVPWALFALLLASALLPGTFYKILLWSQLAGWGLCLLGLVPRLGSVRLLAAAGSFLTLNAAAAAALWVWLTGRAAKSWNPTRYGDVAPTNSTSTNSTSTTTTPDNSTPTSLAETNVVGANVNVIGADLVAADLTTDLLATIPQRGKRPPSAPQLSAGSGALS